MPTPACGGARGTRKRWRATLAPVRMPRGSRRTSRMGSPSFAGRLPGGARTRGASRTPAGGASMAARNDSLRSRLPTGTGSPIRSSDSPGARTKRSGLGRALHRGCRASRGSAPGGTRRAGPVSAGWRFVSRLVSLVTLLHRRQAPSGPARPRSSTRGLEAPIARNAPSGEMEAVVLLALRIPSCRVKRSQMAALARRSARKILPGGVRPA